MLTNIEVCLIHLTDTHALVYFDSEERSSIVPLKRLEKRDDLFVGESCFVIWSDNKRYSGTLLCAGMQILDE